MVPRVLIVDDHPLFRTQARRMLESAGWEVVGEAGDGADGVAQAARLQPDAVLLDVQLPDANGFDLVDAVAEAAPAARVVMISAAEPGAYRARRARGGSPPFIHKPALSQAALAAAIASARR